ncbi:50S ribosomal protein L25 [Desulforhopalus vacuolatus]|uniref:50S ribosomal protein L25 n=1 Tax=Desulforhopalus vacuolatus TaxID=40414 RepID=UPI0019643149|nr:50S ribosomal protein L25 [Desulforhopalus vacuolatus]MBM9520010.1 50S ribosomal protein L25 [Desulforhopalus vacuolatus]
MYQVEISASAREVTGKGPMRQLRMQGKTPGVVYGGGKDAQMLEFDTKVLYGQLLDFHRRNAVVTLNVEGSSRSVRVGEIQVHPVDNSLIHVDFCEIDLDKVQSYKVPIVYTGVAKGVDLGGILHIHHRVLLLSGKPLDIPDEITVDVTSLTIDSSIECKDIPLPANVTLVEDPGVAVVVDKALVESVAAPVAAKKKK